MKPLTPNMLDLLRAMQRGAVVHFMPWSRHTDAYYFRSDTMRTCTKQVDALAARGLLKITEHNYRLTVALTDAGRNYK